MVKLRTGLPGFSEPENVSVCVGTGTGEGDGPGDGLGDGEGAGDGDGLGDTTGLGDGEGLGGGETVEVPTGTESCDARLVEPSPLVTVTEKYNV